MCVYVLFVVAVVACLLLPGGPYDGQDDDTYA